MPISGNDCGKEKEGMNWCDIGVPPDMASRMYSSTTPRITSHLSCLHAPHLPHHYSLQRPQLARHPPTLPHRQTYIYDFNDQSARCHQRAHNIPLGSKSELLGVAINDGPHPYFLVSSFA